MPFSLLGVRTLYRPISSDCLLAGALAAVALLATGCNSHAPHVATAVSVRTAAFVPSPVGKVQSSPLYQQARADCKRHDYKHAADLLGTLAKTPGLAPEAVAFVQQQRAICLQDAGMPTVAPTSIPASLPAHTATARTPTEADCGPRALLLVCQKLGVKTDLETLRKMAGTTAEGTTMAGLQQAAQKLGLKAEGVQVSREALPDISPPALVWLHRDHYAVLTDIQGRGEEGACTVRDPNDPKEQTWPQEKLLQQSSGVLLLLHR